jgi:type I restriction enzyme R subunit
LKIQRKAKENSHQKIVEHVAADLKKRKTLDVLREGVRDRGQKLNLIFFKPNHDKSPEHANWYKKNRLTIIRQLKYSKKNENSIDIVLFVNGIPVSYH